MIKTITYGVMPHNDYVAILGAGPSYNKHLPELKQYIEKYNPIIIGSNYNYPEVNSHFTMFIGKSIFSKSRKKIKSPNIIITGHVYSKQSQKIKKDKKHDYYIINTKATTKQHSYWNENKIVFNKGQFYHWLSNCGYTALLISAFFQPKEVFLVGFDGPTPNGRKVEHYNGDTRDNKGNIHSSPHIIAKKGHFLELIFDFLQAHGVKTIKAFKDEVLWGARKDSLCLM